MKIHELKTWPDFFKVIISGEKTFELRKDDRGFRAGDILRLKEWDPSFKRYTGREISVTATYVLSGIGLQPNWVAMGIKKVGN